MPGEDSYTLKEAGLAIANEEDWSIFLDDLQTGQWFGLR